MQRFNSFLTAFSLVMCACSSRVITYMPLPRPIKLDDRINRAWNLTDTPYPGASASRSVDAEARGGQQSPIPVPVLCRVFHRTTHPSLRPTSHLPCVRARAGRGCVDDVQAAAAAAACFSVLCGWVLLDSLLLS
jgi:hypothetical protein